MGRSVNYLNKAVRVSYFDWPKIEVETEDGFEEIDEYEDSYFVIDEIQESIRSEFPKFRGLNRTWEGDEVRVILDGYGCKIGLSEYCGLASSSIAVDEWDGMEDSEIEEIESWITANWDRISVGYNTYSKVGTMSDGGGVFCKND